MSANTTGITNATITAISERSTTAIECESVSFGFENQKSNKTSVTVTAPRYRMGFIMIHGPTFPQNEFGNIIGVSQYIPANSSFSAVEMPLFENVPGQSFGQQRLTRNQVFIRSLIEPIIEEGIKEDVFRPIDAETMAISLLVAIDGARNADLTLDIDSAREVMLSTLEQYISDFLLVD